MTGPDLLDRNEQQFVTALHERLDSESPDLERLLGGATDAGRRRRRRRRIATGLAGAACIGLAVTAYAVIPGAGDPPAREGQVATGDEGDVVTKDEPTVKLQEKTSVNDPEPVLRDKAPVKLQLEGWTCEYFPVDDKAWCPGPGEVPGGYVVRPAKERDAFLGKSGGRGETIPMLGGKGIVAGDGTIVGPVRNGIFLTVQSGMGFTPELMREFAQSLTWTE